MTRLLEGNLAVTFPNDWQATKYDDWQFYAGFKGCCGGNKAVDFICFKPSARARDRTLWLLELKDYRGGHRRTKQIELPNEIATKARDTIAGLVAAAMDENHNEQNFARAALQVRKIRIVLHLEQTARPSKLFPRPFDRAAIQAKLKQLIKPIDAHPLVIELASMSNVPWSAK